MIGQASWPKKIKPRVNFDPDRMIWAHLAPDRVVAPLDKAL